MYFLEIFNFLLWLISGIVIEPFEFVVKQMHNAFKPFGSLRGRNRKPEDEYNYESATDLAIAEAREPVKSDLIVFVPILECKVALIDLSLIFIGVLTIIICLTWVFESKRKNKTKKPKKKVVFFDCNDFETSKNEGLLDLKKNKPVSKPKKKVVFCDCNDFVSSENEGFPDLKNDDNDFPDDYNNIPTDADTIFPANVSLSFPALPRPMFPKNERFSPSKLKEPEFPNLEIDEEERVRYLDSRMEEILGVSSDKEAISESESSGQEHFPETPTPWMMSMAYEAEHNHPYAKFSVRKRKYNAKNKMKKTTIRPTGNKRFYDGRFDLLELPSVGWRSFPLWGSEQKLLHNMTSKEERRISCPELFQSMLQYDLKKKNEEQTDLPTQLLFKEWTFPNVPCSEEKCPDFPTDHYNIDLTNVQEVRDLLTGQENNEVHDMSYKEEERPQYSGLFESTRKYDLKENYEGHAKLPPNNKQQLQSKEWTFPKMPSSEEKLSDVPEEGRVLLTGQEKNVSSDVPSKEDRPSCSGLFMESLKGFTDSPTDRKEIDGPSAKKEFSIWDYKPEDLPPLPSDDDDW